MGNGSVYIVFRPKRNAYFYLERKEYVRIHIFTWNGIDIIFFYSIFTIDMINYMNMFIVFGRQEDKKVILGIL